MQMMIYDNFSNYARQDIIYVIWCEILLTFKMYISLRFYCCLIRKCFFTCFFLALNVSYI